MLFIIQNIMTENSTESSAVIEQSCTYCQTTACHCPLTQSILNCSSYLLNLPFVANCADMIIWKTVDFSSRNFESFDSTKLLSLRMQRLLLKSNLITSIHDNTFDSIGDILVELDLEMNLLINVSSKWLNSKLIYLKKLNLASNQLEVFINFDDDIQLSHLQELNLSRNLIDIFPNKIHQWTSLNTLDLSFNKLSSIPRFALMGLNNLTWLSLASNRNLSCKFIE
jgi:Leucine-rich repeat (LRR) protein